jgi:hypothetical protein
LRQYSSFLQYNDCNFSARLGYSGGRHGVGGVERKIFVTVELVFRIVVIGVGAIVARASEGPYIARIVKGAVGVVVFGCGGGAV